MRISYTLEQQGTWRLPSSKLPVLRPRGLCSLSSSYQGFLQLEERTHDGFHFYSLRCNCYSESILAYGDYMRPAIILGTSWNNFLSRKVSQFTLCTHSPANRRGADKRTSPSLCAYMRGSTELKTNKTFRMFGDESWDMPHLPTLPWRGYPLPPHGITYDSGCSPYIRSCSAPRHAAKIHPKSGENPIIHSNNY